MFSSGFLPNPMLRRSLSSQIAEIKFVAFTRGCKNKDLNAAFVGRGRTVKRTKTLERFKSGRIRVLIATDVAGRGIHVDGVSHVVNYDLPEDPRITFTA